MPLRTIAQLKDSSNPQDVEALKKLEAKKDLILGEIEATKRKLNDAVDLNDISYESEHAKNVAPKDIELRIKRKIAHLLSIDQAQVQLPDSLDLLSLHDLESVWNTVRSGEHKADHLLASAGVANVLK